MHKPAPTLDALGKESIIAVIGKVTGAVFLIATQIIMARFLGPDLFGLYAIGLTLSRIAETIALIGMDNAIINFGTRYVNTDSSSLKGVILFGTLVPISISIILSIVQMLLASQLERFFHLQKLDFVIIGFACSLPFSVGLIINSAITRISGSMKYSVFSQSLVKPTITIFSFLFFYYLLGSDIKGSVGAEFLGYLIAFVTVVFFVWKQFSYLFLSKVKATFRSREVMNFALPTAFVSVFPLLILWVDRLFIAYVLTNVEVGYYQAIAQIPVLFVLGLRGIAIAFSPIAARLYHKSDLAGLQTVFKGSTRWGVYFSLPIFLVIITLSKDLITVSLGPEYVIVSNVLIVLAIGQFINVISGPIGFLAIMTGNQTLWLLMSTFSFIVNVIFLKIMLPKYGLIGASVSTVISISVLYLGALFLMKRKLNINPYDKDFLKIILAGIGAFVIILVIQSLTNMPSIANLLLNAFGAMISFWSCMWILGFNEKKDVIEFGHRSLLRIAERA